MTVAMTAAMAVALGEAIRDNDPNEFLNKFNLKKLKIYSPFCIFLQICPTLSYILKDDKFF